MSDIGFVREAVSVDDSNADTGIISATVSQRPTVIKIKDPNIFQAGISNIFSSKSLQIDKCIIKYIPQCPITTIGQVDVEIRDNRVREDDQIQATFAFPILCPVTITYYGSSYAPKHTKCPWEARYSITGSNLKQGVEYCKLKASLSFKERSFHDEIKIRAPSIQVNSTSFDISHVKVWHATPNLTPAQLPRARSYTAQSANVLFATIGPSQSSRYNFLQPRGSTSVIDERPNSSWIMPSPKITGPISEIRPEDSISQDGSDNDPLGRRETDMISNVIKTTAQSTAQTVLDIQDHQKAQKEKAQTVKLFS